MQFFNSSRYYHSLSEVIFHHMEGFVSSLQHSCEEILISNHILLVLFNGSGSQISCLLLNKPVSFKHKIVLNFHCPQSAVNIFGLRRMTLKHLVFVYGTLKTGEPNHPVISTTGNAGGQSQLVGPGRTVDTFPLVIASRYNIPYLLDAPEQGQRIRGEVLLFGKTIK